MRLTLAITTYERPDALAAVLRTVAAQSVSPDEVIVADDGSGAATRTVVEQFAQVAPCPVHHVWQSHEGFRVARLRNLAIARASGEYVVFVDGDMVMHPLFIADHREFARRGAFTQGVRIPLDAGETARLLRSSPFASARDAWGVRLAAVGADDAGELRSATGGTASDADNLRPRGRRRLYAWHNRGLASLMRRAANLFIAVKSCNQGFWRDDLVAVNGFDESFVGWGSEDKELCARLQNHGVARQTLLFGGIAFHLEHPPSSRNRHDANEKLLARTRLERRTRCEHGLDAHLDQRG